MKQKRVTIYDVKWDLLEHNPGDHFFDRATMKFFGQTLKSFSVCRDRDHDGLFYLSAPMKDWGGRTVGTTRRYYSFVTHKLYTDEEEAVAEHILAEGEEEDAANATLQALVLGKDESEAAK